METDARLKPCPFCGAAPRWATSMGLEDGYEIQCTNDACPVLIFAGGKTEEEAIANWNARVVSPEVTELIRAARAFMRLTERDTIEFAALKNAVLTIEGGAEPPKDTHGIRLMGKSREAWRAHLDRLFEAAHAGENIPWQALIHGWPGQITADDIEAAKRSLGNGMKSIDEVRDDLGLPPLKDTP